MCDETNEDRQNSEFVALQGIYGDAVVDNRKKAVWNEWRPLDVLIALQPLSNSDGIHCSVTLQFSCSRDYPDKPPKILTYEKKGLSDKAVSKLLEDLNVLAEQKCGEVMIFELTQYTEEFLDKYNKPTLSFYEEMVREKDEIEKLKQQHLQNKENEELQRMKDEIKRHQEALHRSNSFNQNDDFNGQGDVPKLVYYADDKMSPAKISRKNTGDMPCTCNIKGTRFIKCSQRNNKKVYVGNCIGHSPNGSITFHAIDEDGDPLIVKTWTIPPPPDIPTRTKQLNAIHQDLQAMSRLKNPSLIPYIAVETVTESKRSIKQSINIFREYVTGMTLKSYLELSKFSDFGALKVLRHVGLGVFSALSELHNVNVLHKDVRIETVFIDNASVKLVGASLDVRLAEIVDGVNYCDRQTKSQDIYAAAQLLLSIVTEESNQEIPSDLPSSAKDFFSRCLTEDYSQWTAEKLVKHCFLVDTPTNMPNSKENNNVDSESEDEDGSKRIRDISSLANGHSRLNLEFEVLDWLGRGAFGHVLKVRNKLDGSFYAIKHVELNPRSVDLNKNITREVKLLSRLNHENVVRYYNAWIGEITETVVEESTETSSKSDRTSLEDIVAKLGQEVKVNWSMSEGPVQPRDESDSEEDSDDEPWFNESPEDATSSSMFETDSNKSLSLPSETATTISPTLKQVLYIQMEFCEKNTLRQAIDNGLYLDYRRSWRLFREILEGLAHVHQKGMIHRDLKPMNIFLDSKDHVKIGDFGLATKIFSGLPIVDDKASQEDYDGPLTGKVGTALYVAPELQQSESKAMSKQKYNQKVDIYSLGIILFEMFHSPFKTGSERCIVLSNLRKKEVIMPKEFQKEENSKQIHVIRWLLDHNVSSRPTSLELLASEHVPRAVPEGTLSCLLSHTLNERGSRGYQRLVSACLDQKLSAAEDFTYHRAMKTKPMDVIGGIKDVVIKVFRHHGAAEFSPPLLMPRATRWDQYPNAVRVMTSSGHVCHLTHDLRLPFARHTAYHGTKYMRRYVVDRVYRETERTVKGFHPREIIECAFDIVMPKTDNLWPDAELLVVASRAAMENSLKVSIQLNHTELLNALLSSCGVPVDKHARIYPVLVDVSLGRITGLQLQTHLTTLCVTNRDITNIRRLMDADVPIGQLREEMGSIGRSSWSSTIEKAVRELEMICAQAAGLGCDVPITVAPFLAYNATQHRGVFWQMSVRHEQKAAKHRSRDLIAAGGRYDNLVEEFWKIARAEKDHDNSNLKYTSVGFSMSLERMAAILHAAKSMEVDIPPIINNNELPTICICLCNPDNREIEIKHAHLAQELWSSGLSVICWSGAVSDAHDLTKCAIVLVHDKMEILVSFWEGNRVREYKVPSSKVIDFVKQKLSPDTIRSPEFNNRAISWSEGEKSSGPSISVTFITVSEKRTKNMKKQYEMQINNKITSNLDMIGVSLNRVRVTALALECEASCVRLLAANLTVPLQPDSLPQAFAPVLDTYTKRQNILEEALRELTKIVKQNNQSRSPEELHLYALYSIPDLLCRIIT